MSVATGWVGSVFADIAVVDPVLVGVVTESVSSVSAAVVAAAAVGEAVVGAAVVEASAAGVLSGTHVGLLLLEAVSQHAALICAS